MLASGQPLTPWIVTQLLLAIQHIIALLLDLFGDAVGVLIVGDATLITESGVNDSQKPSAEVSTCFWRFVSISMHSSSYWQS